MTGPGTNFDAPPGAKVFRADYGTNAEAVAAMVRAMVRLARKRSDPLTALARHVGGQAPEVTRAQRMAMLVRGRIAYRPDPVDVDVVSDPAITLARGYGDCDDLATLTAALLIAVGIAPAFLVGSSRPGVTEPTHVLPAAMFTSGFPAIYPLEVSSRTVPLGSLPPRFAVWEVVQVLP